MIGVRRVALVLTTLLALLGCEQDPDIVAYASAPLDTGGVGGGGGMAGPGGTHGAAMSGGTGATPTGGTGADGSGAVAGAMASGGTGGAGDTGGAGATGGTGGAGGGEEDACRTLSLTLALFANPARTCTFDFSNPFLVYLLWEQIFRHPPARVDPEVVPPDALCAMMSSPSYTAPVRRGDVDGSWVICPVYCATLNQWVDDRYPELQACSPDAGMIAP